MPDDQHGLHDRDGTGRCRHHSRNETDQHDQQDTNDREHRIRRDASKRHNDVTSAIRPIIPRIDGDGLRAAEDQWLA